MWPAAKFTKMAFRVHPYNSFVDLLKLKFKKIITYSKIEPKK